MIPQSTTSECMFFNIKKACRISIYIIFKVDVSIKSKNEIYILNNYRN